MGECFFLTYFLIGASGVAGGDERTEGNPLARRQIICSHLRSAIAGALMPVKSSQCREEPDSPL